MQLVNCHVRLGGDIANEVFKPRVTPAEVLVLRHLHGPDSVVKLQPLGQDKRAHAGEFDRLKVEYGDKTVTSVFPGAFPQLPVSFKDIGLNVRDDEPAVPAAARKSRKAAAQVGADAGDGNDDSQDDAGDGADTGAQE